jgi:CheY-like chemotaxis protein
MARVLICEPHDDIRALLELVVRRLGHEPVAGGGAALAHPGVDVAVIEPGEADGLQLARALREHGVPVLFTSIYPPSDDLLELGPVAYLVKPFPLSTLERALEQALARCSASPVAAV